MNWTLASILFVFAGCAKYPVVPPGAGLAVPLSVEKATRLIDQEVPAGRYEVRLDRDRYLMTVDGPRVIAGCSGPNSAARRVDHPVAEIRPAGYLVVILPDGKEWVLAKRCDLL